MTTTVTTKAEPIEVSGRYTFAAIRTTTQPAGRVHAMLSKQGNSRSALEAHVMRELGKATPAGVLVEWAIVEVATSRVLAECSAYEA